MASSEGIGRANSSPPQVDQLAISKEQFQNRENELVRRHKAELADVEKKHQKEIEAINASHGEILKETRENTKRTLTEKEAEFQKQIEKFQAMNKSSKTLEKDWDR